MAINTVENSFYWGMYLGTVSHWMYSWLPIKGSLLVAIRSDVVPGTELG